MNTCGFRGGKSTKIGQNPQICLKLIFSYICNFCHNFSDLSGFFFFLFIYLFIFIFLLLFICAYKAWFISPPLSGFFSQKLKWFSSSLCVYLTLVCFTDFFSFSFQILFSYIYQLCSLKGFILSLPEVFSWLHFLQLLWLPMGWMLFPITVSPEMQCWEANSGIKWGYSGMGFSLIASRTFSNHNLIWIATNCPKIFDSFLSDVALLKNRSHPITCCLVRSGMWLATLYPPDFTCGAGYYVQLFFPKVIECPNWKTKKKLNK
jgi:hypothetical protein